MRQRKEKAPAYRGLKVTWTGCDMDCNKAIRLLYRFMIDGEKPKNHNLEIIHYSGKTVCTFTEKVEAKKERSLEVYTSRRNKKKN